MGWHAYEKVKSRPDYCPRPNTTEYTEKFKQQTKPLSPEVVEKWKLWPDLISQKDVIEGETMYGFEEGMAAIWENQHPKDCSKAKFLITGGFESGFGSELHVIGVGLALAMNMGRVYVLLHDRMDSGLADKAHSANSFQVKNQFCADQGKFNLECYYEPWTSCSYDEIYNGTTLKERQAHGTSLQKLVDKRLHVPMKQILALNESKSMYHERLLIVQHSSMYPDIVPKALYPLIRCSPMPVGKHKYWWRSMSVAYFLRPNNATRALIAQHRQDVEMKWDHNKEQCVSVYIRRGDKHLEMKMEYNDTKFFALANTLWSRHKNRTNLHQDHGVMFFGSEDPNALESSLAWGKHNNWKIRYSNLFDRKSVTTGKNNSQQQAARRKNNFVHNPWEYFSMILNLDGHLRCSAFVCTMRSNFCRVIDELRATVASKANRQYGDLSCHTPHPFGKKPCIDDPRMSIDW